MLSGIPARDRDAGRPWGFAAGRSGRKPSPSGSGSNLAAVTDASPSEASGRPRLQEGVRVEVRGGFDGTWSSGFVIEEVTDTGYRLRRRSDSQVLPGVFARANVRRERKSSMWWY